MRVIVEWTETWSREAAYEIDGVELAEWLQGERLTSRKLKEFVLAGREVPSARDLAPKGPGSLPGDSFYDHEIIGVRGQ